MKKIISLLFVAVFAVSAQANHHSDGNDGAEGFAVGAEYVHSRTGMGVAPVVSYRMPWLVASAGFGFTANDGFSWLIPVKAGVNHNLSDSLALQGGVAAEFIGGNFSFEIGAFVGLEFMPVKNVLVSASIEPFSFSNVGNLSGGNSYRFFRSGNFGVSYLF